MSSAHRPFVCIILITALLLPWPTQFAFAQRSDSAPTRHDGYDLDGDNKVDADDLLLMAASMGEGDVSGDLNGDGKTDAADLFLLSSKWGMTVSFGGPLPPAPPSVASPVDRTVVSDLQADTEFLYDGETPIQIEMAPDTIEFKRVAVLRGKVIARSGGPLSGVQISIISHPEFGYTLSRDDGMFDMAVNGGGLLALKYVKEGYLSSQRQVDAPWQDYARLPDVVMVPLDPRVTTVDLTAAVPMQVARGSVTIDDDGTRQATLLVPQGTGAQVVLPDGRTQVLTSLSVRATEYTVGNNGPEAMPALLPPTSGYTYAVEMTADEGLAMGATEVRFDRPMPFYVENFLDFPVGGIVPVGYYDRTRGAWISSDNGRVIEVVSTAGGSASLDIDGDGEADDATARADLGITDAEREKIAGLYAPGQSLWRVPVAHFTPWDLNWPFGPGPGASGYGGRSPDCGCPRNKPCITPGSIVESQNQVLRERIGVAGTPFTLNYRSDRVPGRVPTVDIPLSSATVPTDLKRIDLEILVAGREFTESFPADPGRSYTFIWDGLDAYGRALQGSQPATVRIGYLYDAVYYEPAEFERSFGGSSGIPMTENRAREEVTLWQEYKVTVGGFDARALGLGAWSLDVHHAYDPVGRVLHLGDGGQRSVEGIGDVITTVAGGGTEWVGDGGPATEVRLGVTKGIATGPDGSLYIADSGASRILRVDPDGIITTVAGNGLSGDSGDGGPAIEARIPTVFGIALGPDGSLYLACPERHVVRKVNPNGIITTVAGNRAYGFSGDGGLAVDAQLNNPDDVAVGPDGSLYIADQWNYRIRRVSPDGVITTVVGSGESSGDKGDGGPATAARLGYTTGIDIDSFGNLSISSVGPGAYGTKTHVRRVSPDGIISTLAGTGGQSYGGDGGPATEADLFAPRGIVVAPDGSVYFTDNTRLRCIDPQGIITTVAGDGFSDEPFYGEGGPPTEAILSRCQFVDMSEDGSVYVSGNTNLVHRLSPPLPGTSLNDIIIPTEDANQLYIFNGAGRHLRTLHALTGTVLYEFTYDDERGLLTTITDGDGNNTTIERDADGNARAVIGPYGHRTELSLNEDAYLSRVTNPAEDSVELTYHDEYGLLATLTNPKGAVHSFRYDERGRLIRDEDPAGGFKSLARTETEDGFEVSLTTALDVSTSYRTETTPDGSERRVNTFPNGTQTEIVLGTDGSRVTALPNGNEITASGGPDPRWGMQAPVRASMTTMTPGRLTADRTQEREAVLTDSNNPFSMETVTDTITTNGRTVTTTYDAANRMVTTTSPEGREVLSVLDEQGRLVRTQIAGLEPVQSSYNERGQLEAITHGNGEQSRTTTLTYDANGDLVAVIDSLGQTRQFEHDTVGRITKTTLADGRELQFTYDRNGNIISISPPGRPAHAFSYTAVDLPETYAAPAVGISATQTTHTYNSDQQLTSIVRPDGKSIEFDYDGGDCSCGRLASMTIPRGQVEHEYDEATGNLKNIIAPDSDLSFDYDGHLLTNTVWSGTIEGRISRTYDSSFRVASLRVSDTDPIGFAYDDDDLPIQAGSLIINHATNNDLITSSILGSVTDDWTYNGFGELVSYTAAFNGTPVYSVTHNRDRLGRITERTETIGARSDTYAYTYDAAGQLVEVRENGTITDQYSYDENWNRLAHDTTNGEYDDQDRLIQWGGTSYAYTANGDLAGSTTGTQATTFTYDTLGNLTSVTRPDGMHVEYLIDGVNRRIGKMVGGTLVQGFLYKDDLNPVAELDGANTVVSRFVYGLKSNVPAYMLNGGNTYRIITDHVGSVRLAVGVETGEIVQRMDYDAFGNVINDTNPGFQPFGFAGGLYDIDTGFVRFGTRDYNPATGRWTCKDLIGFEGRSSNLYSYSQNDPVNFSDPTGTIIPAVIAIIVLAGAVNGGVNAAFAQDDDPGGAFTRGFIAGTGGAAVAVGIGLTGGTAAVLIGGAAGGAYTGALTQYFNNEAYDPCGDPWRGTAGAGLGGAVVGAGSAGLGSALASGPGGAAAVEGAATVAGSLPGLILDKIHRGLQNSRLHWTSRSF